MRSNDALTWSFILTLSGGVLILASASMGYMVGAGWGAGMMMGGFNMPVGAVWWMLTSSIVAGIMAIAASIGIRQAPEKAGAWGVLALIAGAMSFVGMGGYLVGGIAVLAGGAIAVSTATPRSAARPPARL